jgi:hypothetical protein
MALLILVRQGLGQSFPPHRLLSQQKPGDRAVVETRGVLVEAAAQPQARFH